MKSNESPTLSHKDWLAIFAFAFAIIFAIAGTIIPPLGVIDKSMLTFIAQLLVFSATMLGFGSTIRQISSIVNSIKGKSSSPN